MQAISRDHHAQAVIDAKLAAAQAAWEALQSSEPNWLWMQEQGEQRLYRGYPRQGVVRQADVVLFVRGEQ